MVPQREKIREGLLLIPASSMGTGDRGKKRPLFFPPRLRKVKRGAGIKERKLLQGMAT